MDIQAVIKGMKNHGIVEQQTGPDYLITSHSIDGTFESCPRRFEFRHVVGQVASVDESGFAADAGTALHEAAQEFTRGYDKESAYLTLARWWPWEAEARQEKKTVRNFAQATLLLEEIMNHEFWDDYEVARLPSGEPAIELPYRINHGSLGGFRHPRTGRLTYLADQGKMDWILRHKREKFLLVTDLKTTTYDESLHDAAYRFSGQAGQYGMVMSAAVGHDFRRHGLKVCYLMAEFGTYGPNVRPLIYDLPPVEVEDLIAVKQIRLRSMLSYAQTSFWPRTTHGCRIYSSPCSYLDICHRRDYPFLLDWFAAEGDRFKFKERIYEPYWILEA